jgi:serine/threonine protein kinase
MYFLFPPRLTSQQREDLEIYGEYFNETVDDDVEIGAEIVKLGSVAYDDDELEGAWEVIKYDPLKHSDLVQSNASTKGLVNESMTKNMEHHVQISEGDEFMFNKLTGATKWNSTQMDKLMTKQEIKAQKRLVENERRIAVRELQHMGREEYAGQILRQLSVLEENQLLAVFGQRLPFKHAGRYEVVHRGYCTEGDGYGRRPQDCFLGQGLHSRTFVCSDSLGHFSNIVVKVSRKTEPSLFAQRGEAGTLKSLEKLDDEVRKKYFVMMIDSFDFGANENRFAMVFEQEGPSLGYLLSMYSREPKVDPLFGKAGLNELDAEFMASVAPWVLDSDKAESDKKQKPTGYLSDPPRMKRKGPVPRPPLPIGFIVEVLQQVCEAVIFLHEKAGMVHGDITPDNIVMVQKHEPTEHRTPALSLNSSDNYSTPYVPSSSQIKLVDLNCACFIPVALPNKEGVEDYEEEEAQLKDATVSPLVHTSIYLKRKAERRDIVPETTLSYRAPELDVFHSGWNAGVDVWSIGCLLVEMYSGKADFNAGMLAAEHPGPDTDSGLAVRAAAIPSLRDIGRCPLFRAETPFEHLAMIESCVGSLPESIYDRWSNIESPAMVGPYARARVASVAPLSQALEQNRECLARDHEARLALTKHHMGELANEDKVDFFGSVFGGGFNKNTEDDKLRSLLREINMEIKSCAVEPWRKDAVADLAAKMLNPDLEKRITMRELVDHKALQTGLFAGFGAGLF